MISFFNSTPDVISVLVDDKQVELPAHDVAVEFSYAELCSKNIKITNHSNRRTLNDFSIENLTKIYNSKTKEQYIQENIHLFVSVLAANSKIYLLIDDCNPHDPTHNIDTQDEFIEKVVNFDMIEDKSKVAKGSYFSWGAKKKSPYEQALEYFPTISKNVHPADKVVRNEKSTLLKRKAKVRTHIMNTLNVNVDPTNVPTIALSFSGGGMRAMMTTAASLDVMKKAGILDMTSYISCLSGSTWAVAPWLLRSGKDNYNVFYPKSNVDYYKFGNQVPEDQKPSTAHMTIVEKVAFAKNIFYYLNDFRGSILGKPTLTHIWGLLIGYSILKHRTDGDSKFADFVMTDLLDAVCEGDNPLPVFTATFNKRDYYGKDYEDRIKNSHDNTTDKSRDLGWLSMGCYTCGSDIFSKIIDSPHLGNLFEKIPLYRYIGIWGSAFTDSLGNMADVSSTVKKVIDMMAKDASMEHAVKNFAEAIYNYSPHDPNTETKVIEIRDGGLRCNIPLYPLFSESRRKCQLAIVFDASSCMQEGSIDIFSALNESVLSGYDVGDSLTQKIKLRIVRSPKGHVIYFPIDMGAQFSSGQYATTNINYNQQDFDKLHGEVDRIVNKFKFVLPNGQKKTGLEIIKDEVKYIIDKGVTTADHVEIYELDTVKKEK
jgi:phospholipase A2